MKTLSSLLTKSELATFKKALVSNASFYKDFKAKIESDPALKKFFAENTAKEIYLEIFSEAEQAENPLYVEKKKTPLCCAIDNLKRLCKEPKEKGSKGKKVNQILMELLYLQDHFTEYPKEDQQSILVQIDHLLKGIKYKTK